METKINVLDHGFVKLLNLSGPTRRIDQEFDAHDTDPANVARVSFNNKDSGKTQQQDLRLCDYLLKNWHTTPFESIECWLEMKLPIFVARQFIRHRTISINEISGRYVTLPKEWYIPEIVGGKAKSNKQGQENNLSISLQRAFNYDLNSNCKESYSAYTYYIEKGVAPEHARLFLHVNHYTKWTWKQNLHNMMHFLYLRLNEHAQIEAREYAKAVLSLLNMYLPNTVALFKKYRLEQNK